LIFFGKNETNISKQTNKQQKQNQNSKSISLSSGRYLFGVKVQQERAKEIKRVNAQVNPTGQNPVCQNKVREI
jgi:hypothetical protein